MPLVQAIFFGIYFIASVHMVNEAVNPKPMSEETKKIWADCPPERCPKDIYGDKYVKVGNSGPINDPVIP